MVLAELPRGSSVVPTHKSKKSDRNELMMLNRCLWGIYAMFYDGIGKLLPYQAMLDEIVDLLNLTGSAKIVDLGCGTGNLPPVILNRGVDCAITGVDSSPSMLARAKKKCGNTVSFLRADLNASLPEQGIVGPFGYLVMVNSLYATADPHATLKYAAGIAKSGATLVVSTPCAGAKPLEILRVHNEIAHEQNKPARTRRIFLSLLAVYLINLVIKLLGETGTYHFATEKDILTWFADSGWEVLEVKKTYGDQNWLIKARRVYAYSAREALTAKDRAAAFRIRHAAYCEPGLMDCPSGGQPEAPHDEFDTSSDCVLYVVSDDQGQIVGSARLIGYSELGHQAENFVLLPADIDKTQHREISRLALDPMLVGSSERQLALLSLLGKVVLDSIDDGCTTWIMTMRSGVLRLLSSFSMPFRLLTEEPITFRNGPVKGGPLSGESLHLASIDLLEVQVAMFAGSPVAYAQMFPRIPPLTEIRLRDMVPALLQRVQDNLVLLSRHVSR